MDKKYWLMISILITIIYQLTKAKVSRENLCIENTKKTTIYDPLVDIYGLSQEEMDAMAYQYTIRRKRKYMIATIACGLSAVIITTLLM